MNGWLGLGGTARADFNLVVQVLMGLVLLAGMVLARRRQIRAHQICQTSVVLLNLALIFGIMVPSFDAQVLPHLREATASAYFGVPALHALLGTIAELLAMYIVLSAGTTWLPKSLRMRNYKPWMRTTLALWWLVIVLGVSTYCVWYRRAPATAAAAAPASAPANAPTPSPAAAKQLVIDVKNFEFEPGTPSIVAGTSVLWSDSLGRHSIVFDDGSFTSTDLVEGETATRTLDTPGTYLYHCGYHGAKGGSGMSGTIVVTAK